MGAPELEASAVWTLGNFSVHEVYRGNCHDNFDEFS